MGILLFTGAKFGKLTLVEEGIEYITPHGHGRALRCVCDCGTSTKIKAHQLVGGSRRCCGCSDYFQQELTDELISSCVEMSDKVGCSLGLAFNFIHLGLSIAEAKTKYSDFHQVWMTQEHGSRYREGGVIGHVRIKSLAAMRGIFCQMDATYDLVECLCGRELYQRQKHLSCGRPAKCACDYMHDRIRKELDRVSVDPDVPVVKDRPTLSSAPKTHSGICLKGPSSEGLCRLYCGGTSDCLSYWALGRGTPNFKERFSCYQAPAEKKIRVRSSSNFMGGTLVQNGGWKNR